MMIILLTPIMIIVVLQKRFRAITSSYCGQGKHCLFPFPRQFAMIDGVHFLRQGLSLSHTN